MTNFSQRKALMRANAKLRREMQALYMTHDTDMFSQMEREGVLEASPCKKGCAACCTQLVVISIPEALYIATKYPGVVRAVKKKLEEQADAIAALSPPPGWDFRDDDLRDNWADAWFRTQTPCAFLGEDNACMIYDARPLSCRSTYLVNAEPSICAEIPTPENPVSVPTWCPDNYNRTSARLLDIDEDISARPGTMGSVQRLVLMVWKTLHS